MNRLKFVVAFLSILLFIQTVLFISLALYYNDKNFRKFVDTNILNPRKEETTQTNRILINELFSYRIYGDIKDDSIYHEKLVKDKSYFAGSKVRKNNLNDIWFFVVDRDGSVVKEMTVGKDDLDEVGLSFDVNNDIIYLSSEIYTKNEKSVYLVRITNFSVEWDLVIKSVARKDISPVVKTLKSGDVVLSFSTEGIISNVLSLAVVRISKNGDFTNITVLTGSIKETPIGIVEFDNSEYWIVGESKSFGFGETDILVVSFKDDKLNWIKVYGTKFAETPNFVLKVDDGVIISTPARHFSLVKVLTNGDVEWVKTYKNGSISSLFKFGDSFFATGTIFDPYTANNIFVFETDTNFNIRWEEFYSFSYDEMPYGISVDSNFIYISGTMYNDKTLRDVWFVKLKRLTNVVISNAMSNLTEYTGEFLSKNVENVSITNIYISSTNTSIFSISSFYSMPKGIKERFEKEQLAKKKLEKSKKKVKGKRKKTK